MLSNSVQNPLFRKVILPWYDTDTACILTGVFMMIVSAFSFMGIAVALETPENREHLWVPCTLLILSIIVVITISVRLFRRRAH